MAVQVCTYVDVAIYEVFQVAVKQHKTRARNIHVVFAIYGLVAGTIKKRYGTQLGIHGVGTNLKFEVAVVKCGGTNVKLCVVVVGF